MGYWFPILKNGKDEARKHLAGRFTIRFHPFLFVKVRGELLARLILDGVFHNLPPFIEFHNKQADLVCYPSVGVIPFCQHQALFWHGSP